MILEVVVVIVDCDVEGDVVEELFQVVGYMCWIFCCFQELGQFQVVDIFVLVVMQQCYGGGIKVLFVFGVVEFLYVEGVEFVVQLDKLGGWDIDFCVFCYCVDYCFLGVDVVVIFV